MYAISDAVPGELLKMLFCFDPIRVSGILAYHFGDFIQAVGF